MSYPNVPDLPGVPQLPRSPNFPPAAQAALGIVESGLWQAALANNRWQIFSQNTSLTKPPTTGNQIIGAYTAIAQSYGIFGNTNNSPNPSCTDTVISFELVSESKVSNFPVQSNSFASYNKVNIPKEIKIVLAKGGSNSDRQSFLDNIDTAKTQASTELFQIITPDFTFKNMSLYDYNYRKEQTSGANMLIVECKFIEIRQVIPAYAQTQLTSNAQNPVDQPKQNNGSQSASSPSMLQQGSSFLFGEDTLMGVISKLKAKVGL
jgi:hypothetical protein